MAVMPRIFLIGLLCAGLALAGCGSGGDGSTQAGDGSAASTATAGESAASTRSEVFRAKPKVQVPSGPPPKQLVVKDLIEGSGAEAKLHEKVAVHYVLVDYETGKELASNWHRGEPGTYGLGSTTVTAGWEQGLVGMKVGGRRELISPPSLAFGANGAPPIPPNATLIWVIDLVGLE
jgi:peptidylprolyl isomerase